MLSMSGLGLRRGGGCGGSRLDLIGEIGGELGIVGERMVAVDAEARSARDKLEVEFVESIDA